MYSGLNGEFIEFTNMSGEPVDMTGWTFDDDHALPGAFALGGFGLVQPGESVVLTETAAEAFRTAWGLAAGVKIIGGLGISAGNNLARNDEINLFDPSGAVMDRLTYGDQTFAGTIRTQNRSGQAPRDAVGQNDVAAWVRSESGDAFGSWASALGDVGTPGRYDVPGCDCPADFNCDGGVDGGDVESFFLAWEAGHSSADVNQDGGVDGGDAETFFVSWEAGGC
jgi:hypothetical protein